MDDLVSTPVETAVAGEWRFGFGPAFIDIDEWRDKPRRHRYVHGGFEGTETRFSFYFPPEELYRGRLVQYLEGGMGGHENTLGAMLNGEWLFDFAFKELGAYLVESNQGHFPKPGHGFNDDVENWGASAESARFSWQVAEKLYGAKPHHGYVWGVSGGGGRTMSCIENGPEVWDGAAPHMCYSGSNHSSWSAEGYWWLQARHKLADVVDALAPGGSGDPFATLTTGERDGLTAVMRHGYPRAAVSQLWQFAPWIWSLLFPDSNIAGYLQDFWNKPGYLGHDEPERMDRFLIDFRTTVAKVVMASEMPVATLAGRLASAGAVSDMCSGVTLAHKIDDPTRYFGAKIEILSGKGKGRVLPCTQAEAGILMTSIESHADLFDDVEAGDEVRITNREFVAWCHLFMHQLDLPAEGELEQEWGGLTAWMLDGKPIYPQVPMVGAGSGGGPKGHSGVFAGKVIHVNTSCDSMVWPNGAVGWTHKIVARQGEGRHERYRMWWIENSPHGDPEMLLPAVTAQKDGKKWKAELVSYYGATSQALRDLVRWAEEGVDPGPSTTYAFTDDGGLLMPETAAARGGVQPLTWVTANGAAKAEVKVGETVRFEGVAQQPPGRGAIVWTEWDFEGNGRPTGRDAAQADAETATVQATYTYDRPGVYFVSFRAGGHREGISGQGLAVENVARARVVVSD